VLGVPFGTITQPFPSLLTSFTSRPFARAELCCLSRHRYYGRVRLPPSSVPFPFLNRHCLLPVSLARGGPPKLHCHLSERATPNTPERAMERSPRETMNNQFAPHLAKSLNCQMYENRSWRSYTFAGGRVISGASGFDSDSYWMTTKIVAISRMAFARSNRYEPNSPSSVSPDTTLEACSNGYVSDRYLPSLTSMISSAIRPCASR
jgi:hypothetical protein